MTTEAEWQRTVIDTAKLYGWRCMHVRRSIGKRGGARGWQTTTSIDGWPDLLLWNVKRPERGLIALELKSDSGTATDEQLRVLAELQAAGVRTMLARPSDFDAVHEMLRT